MQAYRKYQLDVFDAAKRANTIALLPTGSGKTVCACLYMQWALEQTTTTGGIAVFLAPYAELVNQQAAVISAEVSFHAEALHGQMACGVGDWEAADWEDFFQDVRVLIATPAIVLKALQHGFVRMESIVALVADECHHVNHRCVVLA